MDRIEIGVVVRPVGLKGEVKVKMLAEEMFFDGIKNATVEKKGGSPRDLVVKAVRFASGFAFIKFDSVSSMDEAERLRNYSVYIDAGSVDLDDSILIDDLIGFDIVGEDGARLGRLSNIVDYGAGDVMECYRIGGEFSFPYNEHFVVDIDMQKKQVVVKADMLAEVVIQ